MNEQGKYQFGSTLIQYQIVRTARRKKTIEITLDPSQGVLVAAPLCTPLEAVAEVIRKRAGWIIRTGSAEMLRPTEKLFVSGESFPYLGRQVRLFVAPVQAERADVAFRHWSLEVSVPSRLPVPLRPAAVGAALACWYRRQALVRITTYVQHWAPRMQLRPEGVLIRNQRARWGSCSYTGTLRFNWRTIQIAPALIDYVVVHELAHLYQRNHDSEFWARVAAVMPDYNLRRQRLKEAGERLVL